MQRLGEPPTNLSLLSEGLRSIAEMRAMNASYQLPMGLPIRRSISREDLVFLAPYIDEWITGHAPPLNLPAEYHDWRPDELRAFKQRMKQEGLWPA
ncbi:MAG: hypothetical protein P4M07_25315 [Xanthobacteraceae bacterium]|nr:hypothetical protein [Xanthobacteraceae bacterium]